VPFWARFSHVSLSRWVAQRRREAGLYDARTLALTCYAWRRRPDGRTLLSYALFRRDLGLTLRRRLAAALKRHQAGLTQGQRVIVAGLLAEAGYPWQLDAPPLNAVADVVRQMQPAWREEFATWLKEQQGANGICVVGNGSQLRGSARGVNIDAHGAVVRFNRFRGEDSQERDIGSRLNVWVTAPGFDGGAPAGVKWIILSGPAMDFRLQNWCRFEEPLQNGAKIVTVPLAQWRMLVARLQAPPSAGLLFLGWTRQILGTWNNVSAIGFGHDVRKDIPYHHVDARHAAGQRHNFVAESMLLQDWVKEGMHLENAA